MQQREDGRRRWRPRAVPTSAQAPVAPPRCGAVWRLAELCVVALSGPLVAGAAAAPSSPLTPTPSPRRSSRPCC
ncbi:Os01g0727200 [Oryza sativa Japonica Group]|uniref:Os01g0727200 protein n=1 Tax=Oryza sativa subsp. japonica TaxID=39947 RepID=A0A0P0V7N8_ORYSJ|nr:Os01g0727200 [Oryza sativa Japonica Group]